MERTIKITGFLLLLLCCSVPGSCGDDTDRYIRTADSLYFQKEYKTAETFYELAQFLSPGNISSLEGEANCLYKLGDKLGALKIFSRLSSMRPEMLGYADAVERIKEELEAENGIPRATTPAGRSAVSGRPFTGNAGPEMMTVGEALDRIMQSANGLYARGEYEKAEFLYDSAQALFPGHGPSLAGKANCIYKLGDKIRALEIYKDLCSAHPEVKKYWDLALRLGNELQQEEKAPANKILKELEILKRKQEKK